MKGVLPIEQIKERIELFLLEQSRPLLTEPGQMEVRKAPDGYRVLVLVAGAQRPSAVPTW